MLINWTIYVIAKWKQKAQIMDHAIEKCLMVSVSLSTVEIFDCCILQFFVNSWPSVRSFAQLEALDNNVYLVIWPIEAIKKSNIFYSCLWNLFFFISILKPFLFICDFILLTKSRFVMHCPEKHILSLILDQVSMKM